MCFRVDRSLQGPARWSFFGRWTTRQVWSMGRDVRPAPTVRACASWWNSSLRPIIGRPWQRDVPPWLWTVFGRLGP